MDDVAEMREMAGLAVASTAFPLAPITFTCADPSLGAVYTEELFTASQQPVDALQLHLKPSRTLGSAEGRISQPVEFSPLQSLDEV